MSSERLREDDDGAALVDTNVEQDNGETPLLSQPGHPSATDHELSIAKLLALTCINGGLQVFFSTVMANLSPYLQQLGLAKSTTAAIVIALPLSGAFVGPIAGAFSDRLRTRWGRRRPMILGGAILTAAFLVLLSWTEQLVTAISTCRGHKCNERATIALAIVLTILMSIFVQPVQAGVRSLMVDVAPTHQQDRAASWAGRIQGVSAIFSFFASSQHLSSLPGLRRLTQFQALASLNLITLGSTVLITCLVIREKDSRRVDLSTSDRDGILAVLRHIFRTVRQLRDRLRRTCEAQFSSWFAWFPFLYYNTTYIGELAGPDMSKTDDGDALAQAGSLASLNFAIVGFVMISVLPWLVPRISKYFKRTQGRQTGSGAGLQDLIWLWVSTQPLLGILLVLSLATAYQWQGIVLVTLAGIPWAVTQWVPFALVGSEISRLGLNGASDDEDAADSESGAIMGVHNMAISLPQVLSGLVSSVTYMIAEKAGSNVPTAWVLASSGIAAFVASFLASLVQREEHF